MRNLTVKECQYIAAGAEAGTLMTSFLAGGALGGYGLMSYTASYSNYVQVISGVVGFANAGALISSIVYFATNIATN